MELLKEINENYKSSNESSGEDDGPTLMKKMKIESAPDVSGTESLFIQKMVKKLNKFELENVVSTAKNHLTGHVETTHINKDDF